MFFQPPLFPESEDMSAAEMGRQMSEALSALFEEGTSALIKDFATEGQRWMGVPVDTLARMFPLRRTSPTRFFLALPLHGITFTVDVTAEVAPDAEARVAEAQALERKARRRAAPRVIRVVDDPERRN